MSEKPSTIQHENDSLNTTTTTITAPPVSTPSGTSSSPASPPPPPHGHESLLQKIKRHQQLFNEFDTKHKGRLTLEDFKKRLRDANHPLKDSSTAITEIYKSFNGAYDPQEEAKQKVKNIDDPAEPDYVNFEKFNNYLLTAESQIETGFSNVDVDHDGRIGKKEIENYLLRMGLKPTKQEIDTFFERIDTKQKGYITYDMFRDGLLFMPRLNGSRIRTAFNIINEDVDNLNSEGDVTITDSAMRSFGYFVAGGLSGVVSRTCTAPLDRVKVFLIARTDLTSTLLHKKEEIVHLAEEKTHHHVSKRKIQSPIVRAARTLYKQGGIRAFYVGNGLNAAKVFPESAMKFGSFEAAKRFLCKVEGVSDDSKLSKVSTYISGGIGGVIAQCTVYPIDTLKYRLQCAPLDSNVKGFRLLSQTAKEMYAQGGLHMFYRGLGVGLAGMFPYAAMDLGTFTTVKKWYIKRQSALQHIPPEDVHIPNLMVLTLGASSGCFGATMVYPINLLRTRLQAQGTFAHPYTYTGFFDVARQTVQREGFPGLFKGLVPNLAKVAPAVSISYLMYENLKVLFGLD
ncbi:unnamed protein product [Ambrosiozyma monospora]|uniref:Unnamed protein product n=1 Tax=Ambrosiozyma monospora TaxID=43982 RepID=A0ACB5SYH5_AMBMO|nr:unnamed protein product [Ambrosiozyma monospora]